MRSLVALKILLHDRATTLGSLIGVIAIVFLVGQQLAVLFGLFTFMSVLVDHSGADIWVCSKHTSNVNSAGLIPERYLDRISGLPFVVWAEPLLFGNGTFVTAQGTNESVQVVGLRMPRAAAGPWRFFKGGSEGLLDHEGITLDRLDLRMFGNPEYGKVYEINSVRVRVSGITQSIKGFAGRLVFTNMVKAREILKTPPGRCRAILVKLADGIDRAAAITQLQAMLPAAEVIAAADLSALTRIYYVKNTGMGGSFGFSTIVGALVGIIIITLTMYTAVLQRQKDFAVLRALGARKRDILIIVLLQSLMIGVAGIFIGFLLLSLFLQATLDTPLPSYMPLAAAPVLAVGTLLLCILGSVLAMRKAVSIEPASVFR
ncbi:MAG: FtsX-like permease family protein [Desulfobacterota bacterium]|nr:FtsX-like permease family protein [Thermodesulfobacteriota bacterium]